MSPQLIHIAFIIRVGITAAPLLHVDHALVKMGQRNCVLFVDMALHVCLQQRTLVVWKGHGEEGFRVTNKLVHVSLSGDLGGCGETKTQFERGTWNFMCLPTHPKRELLVRGGTGKKEQTKDIN